jgi:hypothetical protein
MENAINIIGNNNITNKTMKQYRLTHQGYNLQKKETIFLKILGNCLNVRCLPLSMGDKSTRW